MEGVNAGNARIPALIGVKGEKGDKGDKGDNGRGVAEMTIDNNGHLIATYTDSETEDVGDVMQRSVTGVEITNTHDIQVDYSDETSEVIGNLNSDIDNIVANRISAFRNYIYPVGSIYETINPNFDPNVTFGGTWERVAEGRTLVGVGTGTDINEVEKTFNAGDNDGVYEHSHGSGEYYAQANPRGDGINYSNAKKDFITNFWVDGASGTKNEGGRQNSNAGIIVSGVSGSADNTFPSYAMYVWLRTA